MPKQKYYKNVEKYLLSVFILPVGYLILRFAQFHPSIHYTISTYIHTYVVFVYKTLKMHHMHVVFNDDYNLNRTGL